MEFNVTFSESTSNFNMNFNEASSNFNASMDAFVPASITETDPVFSASPAAGISDSDISNWNNKVTAYRNASGTLVLQ